MAKKMMSWVGNPMEMMQKMTAPMGQSGRLRQMQQVMQMCLVVCSEMLNAIRQTTGMAAFARPVLPRPFDAWLKESRGQG